LIHVIANKILNDTNRAAEGSYSVLLGAWRLLIDDESTVVLCIECRRPTFLARGFE